jgi:catalase
MRLTRRSSLALLLAPLLGAGRAAAQAPLGERLVDVVQGNNPQVFPGYRVNHAKGIVAEGVFTPSAEAKGLTTAAHLQGPPVPLTLRFSNAGGVPTAADASAGVRGLGIQFHLPGGGTTDLVAISVNGFPVATAEDFIALNQAAQATRPGMPSPTPIEAFLASHPAALRFIRIPKPMPVGYTTLPYFGVHAFRFTNAAGAAQAVRYRIVPAAPAAYRTGAEATAASPNALNEELAARLAQGPAQFRLVVQLADAGDPTGDATALWPEDRPLVDLGQISVTRLVPDSATAEHALGFLPTNLTPGIALGDDPLVQARTDAYVVAYRRRNP